MEKTLLWTGIACVIAAIVGGGFKGLGIEIPIVSSRVRQGALAIIGAILCLSSGASAFLENRGDPNALLASGLAAYDRGDLVRAYADLRRAAALGEPQAEYHAGEMLYHGEGVVSDLTESLRLLRHSAEAGYAPAEASIGGAYMDGSGVPEDTVEARRWLKRASDQGDPNAIVRLAVGAFSRNQRLDDLVEPLREAATAGHAAAQSMLALTLFKRLAKRVHGASGPPPTSARAAALLEVGDWAARAARQGDRQGQYLVGMMSAAAGGDSIAYVWLYRAAQPHAPQMNWPAVTLDSIESLQDRVAARLSASQVMAAQQAARAWTATPERPYRHGH